jgi:hypothetical protein
MPELQRFKGLTTEVCTKVISSLLLLKLNSTFCSSISNFGWKGQGEIRSGDYTVYYSGGERAEKGVASGA